MTFRTYQTSELVGQPIGYWSGYAYRTVVGKIRADLAIEELIQPTWWILNHADGAPGRWTEAALSERLQSFDDQGTDFAGAFDDLRQRGLLDNLEDGIVRLTEEGRAALGRARARAAATVAVTMDGVGDEDYAVALNVLRRIIDNLGGESDLP